MKLEEALLHFNAMKEEVIEINKTKSVILNMVHYILINNLVINVTNSYSISISISISSLLKKKKRMQYCNIN